MLDLRVASAVTSLVFLVACSKTNVTKLPDGDQRIVCQRGMKDCISRADKLCGDDGYTILSGSTKKRLLGGDGSSYREMAESAELIVSCGTDPPPAEDETTFVALPPRTDEPVASAPACVPGASQLCVGPAACQGGQVCLADGSGFGPCDCGPSKATSPSTPAVEPGAATPVAPTAPPAAPKPVPGAMPPAEPL